MRVAGKPIRLNFNVSLGQYKIANICIEGAYNTVYLLLHNTNSRSIKKRPNLRDKYLQNHFAFR